MTDQSKNLDAKSNAELQMRFASGLHNQSVSSLPEFVSQLNTQLSVKDLARLVSVDIEFRKAQGELAVFRDYFEAFPRLTEVENEQTITKSLYESTAVLTEMFVDEPTEKTRQLINTGETIDDFELLAELGRGSFATVFLARQVSMQRMVALKVSIDHGMEAQTLAQLDHPYIVRVFDQRKACDFDLQLLYMQYLEGGTLLDAAQRIFNIPGELDLSGKALINAIDQAVVNRGSSPNYDSTIRRHLLESNWDQVICRIGYYLAQALEHAHKKGVLHRDIKPANVLIGSDCCMKLADFNISSSETVVGQGKFGGSLAYMSPEQIRAFNPADKFSASKLDERCDIYSLGVMLIQLLKGSLPFSNFLKSRRESGLEAMVFEREQSKEKINQLLDGHSPLLQIALKKCIEPKIEDRHTSARELATQLQIGLDREAEQLLYPENKNWTIKFRSYFYMVCISVALVLNIMAALFVFNFNLIDAVPEHGRDKFMIVQGIINLLAFSLAIFIFAWLTYPVFKALRIGRMGSLNDKVDLKHAISRNLTTGHIQATVCGVEWLIAGILYPIVLTLIGISLSPNAWINFIASHALAGVSITTLTFFAMTFLTLRIWFPVLIQHSFSEEVVKSAISGLNSLLRMIPIYQLLAVSIPLVAMALLVIFGDAMASSKFALTVISIFGLFTIPLVLFGGNKIRAICERLLVVFRND